MDETSSPSHNFTKITTLSTKKIPNILTSSTSQTPKSQKKRRRFNHNSLGNTIRIVSATYGPCDGRRLLNGEWSNTESERVPHTRDVLPFLRAILIARNKKRSSLGDDHAFDKNEVVGEDTRFTRKEKEPEGFNYATLGNLSVLPLTMDGKSMNVMFGDPCPGTTKMLRVQYYYPDAADATTPTGSLLCRDSFYEHEKVILRKRICSFQDDPKLFVEGEERKENDEIISETRRKFFDCSPDDTERKVSTSGDCDEGGECGKMVKKLSINEARKLRSQSIAECLDQMDIHETGKLGEISKIKSSNHLNQNSSDVSIKSLPTSFTQPEISKKWRLNSATAEIVLPLTLPFLTIRERAICKFICCVWKFILKEWGVAKIVDVKRFGTGEHNNLFTKKYLCGVISNSYSSLESLFLNDYAYITDEDIHPAIPHLRKLKNLDISRCNQFGDVTLCLIAKHCKNTLEVLYVKGLRKLTDKGVMAVTTKCLRLRVLEVSNVLITDASGISIGQNLRQLEALYMRDNSLISEESINCITSNCKKLTQLTLWGCFKLKNMKFENDVGQVACESLVLLNLWGCLGLVDDCAKSLASLKSLRTLIVSECHRLTDRFVVELSHTSPNIQHLHLRYVRRITDLSINAIAQNLHSIYSLDLSFCTKITSSAICHLLETRANTLMELKLYNCSQLNGIGVRSSVDSLRASTSVLAILDLRGCLHLSDRQQDERVIWEEITHCLLGLAFEQKIDCFFVRPAKWRGELQSRMADQFRRDCWEGGAVVNSGQ